MPFTPWTADRLLASDDLPERLPAAIAARAKSAPAGGQFAPALSYGRHFGPVPLDARPAAVVALLFRRGGRWHIPLTVRPQALGRHGGQISLPGGAVDPGESSELAARRELAEELGVSQQVQLIGSLRESYVYVSNFRVTPWIAATSAEPQWRPHTPEVDRVVEMPLETLLDPRAVDTITIQRGPLVFEAPCYRLGEDCVWGATSIILSELGGVLRSAVEGTLIT